MRSIAAVLCIAYATVVTAIDYGTWIEKDNLIIIEAEHGFPANADFGDSMAGNCKTGCWKYENTHQGYEGSRFRGDGYIQWYTHQSTLLLRRLTPFILCVQLRFFS